MEDEFSRQDSDANPRSPVRTVQVLHALAVSGQGVSLGVLAARLQLPKTSVFRLLRALEDGGYVTSSKGVHQLGSEAIKLGVALVQNREFPNCARPAMEWLAAECNETVILGTFDDSEMQIVYILVIEPSNPLRFSIKSGLSKPLYSSAIGQTLLAYMPTERIGQYLQRVEFVRLAANTITSAAALQRKIIDIRADGICVSVDGMFDGVYSIAAPVLNGAGKVFAGLSISAPGSRGPQQQEKFAGLLTKASEEISRVLGYTLAYPPP